MGIMDNGGDGGDSGGGSSYEKTALSWVASLLRETCWLVATLQDLLLILLVFYFIIPVFSIRYCIWIYWGVNFKLIFSKKGGKVTRWWRSFLMNLSYMVTILFEQQWSNTAMYEHRYLENVKKLYKSAVKCDDQQQYKAIIVSTMVSTTDGGTNNIPMSPSQYITVKIISLYVKHNTSVYWSDTAKKHKAIRSNNTFWSIISMHRGHKCFN